MTKSRSSAVLEKRQAKYESRPVDECAAVAGLLNPGILHRRRH